MLTVAALVVAVLLLPVSPYIRYQNLNDTIYARAKWIYERIHYDPAPIDVVFIGSSRTGAAVYPSQLEPALKARGIDAAVVNFSLPSTGFDIRDTIIRELYSEKKPRLIVFSVVEAFPRDGHEAFGEIATEGEIAGAPLIVNRNLPQNLLRLPMRQLSLSLASWMPETYGWQGQFNPATYAGTTSDLHEILRSDSDIAEFGTTEHADVLAKEAARRKREITPPILPDSLAWVEFGVSRSYVERIAKLAEANGTEIAFLFLPFYTGPEAPMEERWLDQFGPVWKADLIRDDPNNYRDSGHAAPTARVVGMVTNWLADRVASVWH